MAPARVTVSRPIAPAAIKHARTIESADWRSVRDWGEVTTRLIVPDRGWGSLIPAREIADGRPSGGRLQLAPRRMREPGDMVEPTQDPPPGGLHGTSRSFIGAIAVIGLMAAVNLAAFVAVREAGHRLESQTGDELAARQVRFDAANMNGDQNRYVLEGGAGRGRFLDDAARFEAALSAARRAQRSPQEQRLLASIAGRYRTFRSLDERVSAALSAGRPDRARALAFGPETAIYEGMADDAARLERLSAADHRSALGSYNRTQEIALAVLLVLDVAAAALVVALLAERRRTGQMLDASTERYRTLVEQLPAATFIMDATGTPTYVSPQIEGILGRSPEQLRTDGATPEGRLPWFHPDDADQMRRHVAPVYHGAADGYDFRARMLRHDGSVRHLHAIASARRAADGTLTAVQGILMDVTGERSPRSRPTPTGAATRPWSSRSP